MKKLLVLIFAAFSMNAIAQEEAPELPMVDGKVVYQEVVEVSGASAGQLYDRVHKWLEGHYTNFSAKVVKVSKEEGVIEYKNKFTRYRMVKKTKQAKGYIQYNCKINFKDGKIRYTINEIVSVEPGAPGVEMWYDKDNALYDEVNWPYYLQQVKDYMDALTKGLREEAIKPEEEDNDDW